MALSPVRRQGWPLVRALLGWRQLAWALTGAVATALVAISSIPGSGLAALVTGWTFAGGAGYEIRRRDRELKAAERLHTRPPTAADPASVPLPERRGVARRLRLLNGAIAVTGLMAVAVPVVCIWLTFAPQHELGSKALPQWAYPVLALLGGWVLVSELRQMWRTRRQLRDLDVNQLQRGQVTVLGFADQQGVGVVFVPGVVDVPRVLAESAGEDDALEIPADGPFCARMGRRLGSLIPGDVLVCDGPLEKGSVVALSTADQCDWSEALTVLPWSAVRDPIKTETRQSLSASRTTFGSATYGRRVAVRRADGTVVIPGPEERGSS